MKFNHSQLTLNMVTSITTFVVSFGINFILTPFIVKHLGADAYGFIGLSTNIISYMGLITIALNSMAGRFITISYCAGDIHKANKYFSSVFIANIFLGLLVSLISMACIIWIESIINIPEHLINDVRMLFVFLVISNILSLITNTWGVSTFIKNRLDVSNIRNVIGNIFNGALLVLFFTLFSPHLWYIGFIGFLLTLYTSITNYKFSSIFTPELQIKASYYDWEKIVELIKSGIWNLISKLGDILGQGLDLLIANLCIGTIEMGLFAITKNIPFLILGLFQTISGVFAPIFTHLYAQKQKKELLYEINKSIRILSFFTAVPLTMLYIFGGDFFKLWLPTEDSSKLLLLTILGTFALPGTLPFESLWNIFTVTNKIKIPTIFTVVNNIIVFAIVMTSMTIIESPEKRLFVLSSTRSICGLIRGFIFLPIYGAKCLNISQTSFYTTVFKSLFSLALSVTLCYSTRSLLTPNSWPNLILAGVLVCIICCMIGYIVILNKDDKQSIIKKLFRHT